MVNYVLTYVKSVIKDERGQGMVEYGLILAVIAVVALVGFTNIGDSLLDKVNEVAGSLGFKE